MNIFKETQRIFSEKENSLIQLGQNFSKVFQGDSSLESLSKEISGDLFNKQGLIFFFYKNDSLVYWSDNHFYIENHISPGQFREPFVKLSNGWFRIFRTDIPNGTIISMMLVKSEYPYQNDYLVNSFQRDFNIPPQTDISLSPSVFEIHSFEGEFLFSLIFQGPFPVSDQQVLILFVLALAGFLLFIVFMFHLYKSIHFLRNRNLLFLFIFFFDVLFLRFLTIYFNFPAFLYNSKLFGPYYFATSFLAPSLGDLVTNSLIILILAYIFFSRFTFSCDKLKSFYCKILILLLFLLTYFLFFYIVSGIRSLILDSSIVLNLNNIFNIDAYAALGFITLASWILSFFIISAKIYELIFNTAGSLRKFIAYILISFIIAIPILYFTCKGNYFHDPVLFVILLCYVLLFVYFSRNKDYFRSLSAAVLFIILFSFLSTYLLNINNNIKEKENTKLIAAELSSKRDPLLEYEFMKIEADILSDSTLKSLILSEKNNAYAEKEIIQYLDDHYFTAFWNKYELLITICDQGEILSIQPEGYLTDCFYYFADIIDHNSEPTISEHLYFLNNKSENNNYIAVFDFPGAYKVIIELFYKFVTETGLGYPELLIDKEVKVTSDLTGYSYARFVENNLVYKYGDFSYALDFSPYDSSGNSYFVDVGGYNHFVYKTEGDNTVVISRKIPSFLDIAAPFSFLFIFYGISLILFLLILYIPGFSPIRLNFRNRLQLAIISIIILSFLVIGFITRLYIVNLSTSKNKDNLSEKTLSVLVEMEHKFGDLDKFPEELKTYASELLYKFSLIFFSDINLYDTEGSLIASSRPQIFAENLLSRKINTTAFDNLTFKHQLLYIQNEKIGEQEYLSAYIPFRNNQDKVIAYLNLPYFAKQTEMKKEISDFLAAYINTYVLLIVLAILITILVSRYITYPLELIREKMARIGFGKTNEKIEWTSSDEIGSLVNEYNRMLDDLARSAELLARSERESAWREMAKQVAHEIKNPLTPMKLSVQHLKKAWDEKSPGWEERLDRFTSTIIEQIESLSDIASEFSDFAKMPVASMDKIDLAAIILASADLFKDSGIRIELDLPASVCNIIADKKQMLRVFNNLIKNSVQAIGKNKDGLISISLREEGDYFLTDVSDNGPGIPASQADKIFTPSFTTKSSGMGLGLAMVKSILTGIGGAISFTSEAGKGTTFSMNIPRMPDN